MSEWYEDLTAEELEGKHVWVVTSDGSTVCGRLNRTEQELYVAPKTYLGVRVFIVCDDETIKDQGIRSVSLVWDERGWEQITFDDIPQCGLIGNANYYAVINGFREQIAKVDGKIHPMVYLSGGALPVPAAFVSDFLRRKPQVPQKPGAYRDPQGGLFVRYKSQQKSWMYVSGGFDDAKGFIGDEEVLPHLPLSPVHFVDGPAESNK